MDGRLGEHQLSVLDIEILFCDAYGRLTRLNSRKEYGYKFSENGELTKEEKTVLLYRL
jgi:hypothetical protein